MKQSSLYWYVLLLSLLFNQVARGALPGEHTAHNQPGEVSAKWHNPHVHHDDGVHSSTTNDDSAHCCHSSASAPCNGSAIVALTTVPGSNGQTASWNRAVHALQKSCWLEIETPPPRLIL